MARTSPILIESRTEFAVGSLIFILRWLTRWRTAGLSQWYVDDWFSISAWVSYAVLIAMVEFLARKGAAAGFSQEVRESLPPATVAAFIEGGKAMYASFYMFICLVWSLKAMLLGFYLRFTDGLKYYRYIKVVAIFAFVCFVAAIVTTAAHCLPVKRNWQVIPDPGPECSAGISINIVIATGNFITDALLVTLPFLILKGTRISVWRKVKIVVLLSLGLFVMAMTLIRCILTVQDPTTVNQSSIWAMREGIVAILAVNAPVVNAFFHRSTWTNKPSNNSNSYGNNTGSIKLASGQDYDMSGSQRKDDKIEIYKMTDFETSSKESTKELVDDVERQTRERQASHKWPVRTKTQIVSG